MQKSFPKSMSRRTKFGGLAGGACHVGVGATAW